MTQTAASHPTWNGIRLVDIPSGMGGTFPAAVAADHGEKLDVICLHPDFFNNWLLTVKAEDVRPFSYALTAPMRRIIRDRRPVVQS
jgi:hypothetical protein